MTDRAWVATRKGLFEMRRGAGGWSIANVGFLGEPVSMVLPPTASQRMLAALNLGHFGVKLHASDDGGGSWNEVTTPTYPEQPADAKGPAWKLVQIWSLAAQGDTVYAGTLPGGLFRSDDRGASWQLNESLWHQPGRAEWFGGGYDVPGIHSICPHPTNAGELLVGISCGGVWATRDGGRSWSTQARGMRAAYMPPERAEDPNIQDPHCVVRCTARPEVLWTQHHNGIWRSADNAESWQEVTTAPLSSFGFAVAVHPDDADTAWFVPGVADEKRVPVDGALVVNRTTDGGRSFETLRAGLPQSGCYDLVYRHGLAVAPDGRHLMMGSTTGGLWASDDGGESWTTVSNLLPPIYAVRFG
ncbi:exo-alpha-sialidase [Piscinibacter sp. XHJ-5]|uniref:WD40/YVTN/BNR-like repeat-containing protein n=1 Tax=Piscinibacter sp. XHJ-5 TaxID=3037797 RepID=UPI002452CFE8|nr:exo-alpha-sialidase [Piscinibacter sp. XHJ-5]